MVFATVAGMATALPPRRGGRVVLDGRRALRQGEHREGGAYHAVSIFIEGDGMDGIPDPDELPVPSPEHEPREHTSREALPRHGYGGVERDAGGPAAILHHEVSQA